MKTDKKNLYKKSFKKEKSWRAKKQQIKERKEKELLREMRKKKKKLAESAEHDDNIVAESSQNDSELGRSYTVSIALPGSILDNAQSAELRTYLAGQIARAAVIFQVDEIVIFDEFSTLTENQFEKFLGGEISATNTSPEFKKFSCNTQLSRILQFLECPQYLRKQLFPLHKDLQYAGLLNPLDCLHHFRSDDLSVPYREGVVVDKPTKSGTGAYCNAGLSKEVYIDQSVQSGIRVTLKLDQTDENSPKHHFKGKVVSPLEPKRKQGLYWGYTVRIARNISCVFDESTFPGGYDLTIGTSDKGHNIDSVATLPDFRHLMIMFGGVSGLESCVENDQSVKDDDPSKLFHLYLNTCPDQGSRTIRTEEAILISMGALRPKIKGV
uniref:Uncharacterized protein n=1 Tax=Romanomermis culicivorax TaxID=13658 RepID=A0A915HMR4_ROMCU